MPNTPQPPQPQTMMIPAITLGNMPMRVDKTPDGTKIITLGPCMIQVPLSAEAQEWLKGELGTGIQIVRPPGLL